MAPGAVVDLVVSVGPYDWQTNPGDGSRLVSCCGSTDGQIVGLQEVGGLIGDNQGSVEGCYAASTTTRSSNAFTVWELLGSSYTSVVVDSYFLVSRSGGFTGGKGIGLTDAQMRQRSSFAAWDFYGTDADGRQDRWFMPEGSYPVLIWQTQVTGWLGRLQLWVDP
jgi:hypothetical protein